MNRTRFLTDADEDNILAAIGSTEPSTFGEFCRGLKICPAKGDRDGWRELFAALEDDRV